MHERERTAAGGHLLARRGHLGEAHRVVHRIVLPRAASAQGHDGEAHGANVHRCDRSRLRRFGGERDRRRGEVALGRLEDVARAAQLADHGGEALRRSAAVERGLDRHARRLLVGLDATEHEQLRA